MTPGEQQSYSGCRDLIDARLCYTLVVARSDEELKSLLDSGAILIPARLVAGPLHALQVVKLAARNWGKRASRARLLPLEALLYALAARGEDATRVSLSEVASEGPRVGEPLVAVCSEESLCERIRAEYPRPESVSWLDVPEDLALSRSALAALEVERKKMRIEETA